MEMQEYLNKVQTIYHKQGLNYKHLYGKCTDKDLRLICKTLINFNFPEEWSEFGSISKIKDISSIITDKNGEIVSITWDIPKNIENKTYFSMFYLSIKQTSYINMITTGWINYINFVRYVVTTNNEQSLTGYMHYFDNPKYNRILKKLITHMFTEESFISKKISISQSELNEVFSEKNGFKNITQSLQNINGKEVILLEF